MKIRLLGKTWDLRFLPHDEMGNKAGSCDHPSQRNKSIDIWDELRGEECLDTIIHECLHAGAFNVLGEWFCEKLGTDIARAVFSNRDALRRILDDPRALEVFRELDGSDQRRDADVTLADARPSVAVAENQQTAAQGDGGAS